MRNKLCLIAVSMLVSLGCMSQERVEKENGPMKWYEVRQDGKIGIEEADGTIIVPLDNFNDTIYFLGARTIPSTTETHPSFAGEINVDGKKYYAIYDFSGSTTYRFSSLGLGEVPQPSFTTDKKQIKAEIKRLSANIKQNPTCNDVYQRGWYYYMQRDFNSAFKDFAYASNKEECSAFMAYLCVTMMDMCEFGLNLKAEAKKQMWSTLIGIIPDITATASSISSLFAPVSAGASVVIGDGGSVSTSGHKDKVWSECDGCKGTKLCKMCGGSGTSLAKDGKCHTCNGKGVCPTCKGRGGSYIKCND